MKKKIISLILIFAFTTTIAIPALADEETESMSDTPYWVSLKEDVEIVEENYDEILSEYEEYLTTGVHPLQNFIDYTSTGNFGKIFSGDKDENTEVVAKKAIEKYASKSSNWASWVRSDEKLSRVIPSAHEALDDIVKKYK